MVHAHVGQVGREREALGRGHPHEQRARETRARGTRRPRRGRASSTPASTSASAITGVMSSTCARLATSGTTPPKRACRSTWLDTTDDHTRAAVLHHRGRGLVARRLDAEDERHQRRPSSNDGLARQHALDRVEQRGVLGLVDLVRPHHQRVLVDLLVVVLAHADGREPEAAVHVLRADVRHAHLERDRGGAALDRLAHEHEHQPRADLGAVALRVDRDRGDVRLVERHHQPRVPDQVAPDARDVVRARRAAARAPT